MTDNVLDTNFSDGDPYQSSQLKQLITALNAAVVGRVGGVPTRGQSLGSPIVPWGTVYAENLNVGGQLINITSAVRRKNSINSGRPFKRDSALPGFIAITANSFNFNLLGAETPLSLTIDGQDISINRDIQFSMVAPPVADNTTVLRSEISLRAPDAFDTSDYSEGLEFYAGEKDFYAYDSANKITIGVFGNPLPAAINNLLGKYATFRYGATGLIFGKIIEEGENSYSIINCERAKFFNANNEGIETQVLRYTANQFGNDVPPTVTLMQTGWLFIQADGSGEVSYLSPIISNTAPAPVEDGQYWFNSAREEWNRATAGVFSPIARIPVAILVADNTGVIGHKSLDFSKNFSNLNTCRPDFIRNTNDYRDYLKKIDSNDARISVYGNTLLTNGMRWQAPEPPAGSPNTRITGLDANAWYYFYVSEAGLPQISKVRPRHRPDLLGYYHPFESWRCVARTYTNANSEMTHAGYMWFKYNPTGKIEASFSWRQSLAPLARLTDDNIRQDTTDTNANRLVYNFPSWYFTNPPGIIVNYMENNTNTSGPSNPIPGAFPVNHTIDGRRFNEHTHARTRPVVTSITRTGFIVEYPGIRANAGNLDIVLYLERRDYEQAALDNLLK